MKSKKVRDNLAPEIWGKTNFTDEKEPENNTG